MDAYGTPTWKVEARKHLEKLPDEMKEVERVRTAHLADAQACTRILEAMREEQRRLRRVLGVARPHAGGRTTLYPAGQLHRHRIVRPVRLHAGNDQPVVRGPSARAGGKGRVLT